MKKGSRRLRKQLKATFYFNTKLCMFKVVLKREDKSDFLWEHIGWCSKSFESLTCLRVLETLIAKEGLPGALPTYQILNWTLCCLLRALWRYKWIPKNHCDKCILTSPLIDQLRRWWNLSKPFKSFTTLLLYHLSLFSSFEAISLYFNGLGSICLEEIVKVTSDANPHITLHMSFNLIT